MDEESAGGCQPLCSLSVTGRLSRAMMLAVVMWTQLNHDTCKQAVNKTRQFFSSMSSSIRRVLLKEACDEPGSAKVKKPFRNNPTGKRGPELKSQANIIQLCWVSQIYLN